MANFTYEVLKDTTKQTVIKLTGTALSSDESNGARISANSLYRALDANNNLLVNGNTAKSFYGLSVYRIWYDVGFNAGAYATLTWSGANQTPIITMSGVGEYNQAGNWIAIPNKNTGASVNGNIGLFTSNVTSGAYSIIIELHKDNNYYDAGQLIEPNAFNYNPYDVTP